MSLDAIRAAGGAAPVQAVDALARVAAALRGGQDVRATVIGTLDTGAIRVALLGTFLDLLTDQTLKPGETLSLALGEKNGAPVLLATRLAPSQPGIEDAARLAANATPFAPTEDSAATTPAGQDGTPARVPPSQPDIAEGGLSSAQGPSVRSGTGATASPSDVPASGAASGVASEELSQTARAALDVAIPRAAARQGSQAALYADATAVLDGPTGRALPAPAREVLTAILARPLAPERLDAAALRTAVAQSGTFFEAALAATRPGGEAPAAARTAAAPLPSPEGAPLDAKGLLLTLKTLLAPLAASAAQETERPPAPPRRGTTPAGQAPAVASLTEDAPAPQAAARLLGDTERGLDRIRLLQAASLPDHRSGASPARESTPDRLVELPLALPGGQVAIMGLAVGRDGGGAGSADPASSRTWRMRLSLDFGDTGPMHALIGVREDRATVTLWAEAPHTAAAFREGLGELRDALSVTDLEVEALDVRAGAPPVPAPPEAGTFMDRRS